MPYVYNEFNKTNDLIECIEAQSAMTVKLAALPYF